MNDNVEISGLIIPLQSSSILLPNVAMAELVPLENDIDCNTEALWDGGLYQWRGIDIPIIIYDAFVNPDLTDITGSHIAVMNTLGSNASCQFFGILVSGIPRLTKLTQADLKSNDEIGCEADKIMVTFQGESYRIPDLELIEQKALQILA